MSRKWSVEIDYGTPTEVTGMQVGAAVRRALVDWQKKDPVRAERMLKKKTALTIQVTYLGREKKNEG